jgi:ribosomal protein S17E
MEEVLDNLNRRVDRIEQILPTLATKDDLQKAIAPLATKEELRNAVAGLATKEELRNAVAGLATKEELRNAVAGLATKEEVKAEGERTRAHFDAVAERLEEQIRLLAEGLLSLTRQFEEFKAETNARFAEMDRRLARLEARYAGS